MDVLLIYATSLMAPFVGVIISWLTPHIILLEEAFKGGLVIWLVRTDRKATPVMAFGIGLAYGLSEMILYSLNYWPNGQYEQGLARLLLTIPMHGVTAWFWYLGIKAKRVWLGAALALGTHIGFNYLVGDVLTI